MIILHTLLNLLLISNISPIVSEIKQRPRYIDDGMCTGNLKEINSKLTFDSTWNWKISNK